MFIELTDDMVEMVIVNELKWAFEHTFNNYDEGGMKADDVDLRESLRDVISYFMPPAAAAAYLKESEEKYGH